MPRDLPLSNGRLMVTFDSEYALRDIYYPHVGMENHAFRCRSRLGVWAEGEFSWLDDGVWQLSPRYAEDSLVTRVEARNQRTGLVLTIEDCVDLDQDILLRRFTARSSTVQPVHDVRLFIHLDVALGGNVVGDTVFFHPACKALVAYKNVHYLLLGGRTEARPQFDAWTTGRKDGTRESWRDAEDGSLAGVPLSFGSVDCVGELRLGTVRGDAPSTAHAWLAAGGSLEAVGREHDLVLDRGPDSFIRRTHNYWRTWVANATRVPVGFFDLPASVQALYRRSLLTARACADDGGAIIASPDSEISGAFSARGRSGPALQDVFYGQENYSYAWPRDGALVAIALSNAGYSSASSAYLNFCFRTMVQLPDKEQAYMLQKYLPNGAVASNVIAWVDSEGDPRLPIQEDETALVLIAVRSHYERYGDLEFAATLYRKMITGMANFLADFRDPRTGLPLPSQDLWEERQGVHAFTIATVYRALQDAAFFTDLFDEPALTSRYQQAALEIRQGAETYLYDRDAGRFARSVQFDREGTPARDMSIDASVWALPYFGLFEAADPRVVATMDAVQSTLMVPGEHGGLARFEGDTYQLRVSAPDLPGNPWHLCTLWLAQYQLLRAQA
ncbi:MAG TPA: glycoside hydrolase family 15 protein, partial [Dehalococcoidia bacterium]|nr:glycoside hydrolase family 15 protein [Dehalococcoidia bacterium]